MDMKTKRVEEQCMKAWGVNINDRSRPHAELGEPVNPVKEPTVQDKTPAGWSQLMRNLNRGEMGK